MRCTYDGEVKKKGLDGLLNMERETALLLEKTKFLLHSAMWVYVKVIISIEVVVVHSTKRFVWLTEPIRVENSIPAVFHYCEITHWREDLVQWNDCHLFL